MRTIKIALILSVCLVLSSGQPREGGGASDNAGGPGGLDGQDRRQNMETSGGGSRNNSNGGRPRGDDPRPLSWATSNAPNETEFDDRKSPRKITFLGKSANIRIFPNFSDNSTYVQLRFGRIVELDANGQPVPNHKIASLADTSDAVTFTSGNRTFRNSANASFVNVTLQPMGRSEFRPLCGGGNGNTSVDPLAQPPRLSVELLFGLDDVATLAYGKTNITLPRNGLKWTIAYSNWPFCNDSNSLSISLDLLLPANASAETSPAGAGGFTTLTLRLGTEYNASLTFLDYALDGPDGTTKMPVNVTVSQKRPLNSSAEVGSEGGERDRSSSIVTVNTVLPNPKSRGAVGVWYDPTSTTTSVYLSADDPGNSAVAVTTSGATNGGSANGAAAGLRVTVWAALAALLLSAFLLA